MTAKEINTALYQFFDNYEYKLNNTFVFNWESDFFAMSKSSYFIECEIKISRGDFFVDFKKDKHKIFQDITAGKKFSCYKTDWAQSDVIIRDFVERHTMLKSETIYDSYSAYHVKIDTTKELIEYTPYWNKREKGKGKKFIVNDWDFNRFEIKKERPVNILAPATGIAFHDLSTYNTPHQLYYAVPKGLITLQELPKYAGLLEFDGQYITMIKRAPYMHKRPMDLTRLLLKKYYNLWQYKVPHETKMSIRNNYSE